MPQIKISQLPELTTPTPDDFFAIVDNATGLTKKIALGNLPAQVASVFGRTAAVTAHAGDYTADQITETTVNKFFTAARAQYKSFITIGASNADFITTGIHDGAVFQAAINSLPATGGRIFVRNGTYNWDDSTDRCNLNIGNVLIEGETYGGVIFKATASLHPGGSDRNGSFGILTIGHSQVAKISKIGLRNIIFDINHVAKSAGLTINGGDNLTGIGTEDVVLENITVKNALTGTSDPLESGMYLISGITNFGNRGYINNLLLSNCDIGYSYQTGLVILGTNITRLKFYNCYVHDCNYSGVGINDYGGSITMTDWDVLSCRFERNMIVTLSQSMAHFRDGTQVGINNFTVDHCYFGPTMNPGSSQDYALTPYAAANNRITHNIFDRGGSGISLGASIAGSYARIFPLNRLQIEDNIFYQMRSCFDNDSNITTTLRGNIFYEVKQGAMFEGYSRHFPTKIQDNFVYNCHTNEDGSQGAYNQAAFVTSGDGYLVSDNYIIDDRKLPDPTDGVTIGQVAGGTLGARTYYVRYSWANDTGETLAKAEISSVISANYLAQIYVGFAFVPTGAKKLNIYISSSAGAETLQTFIALPNYNLSWTEPLTGLITGTALPTSNTTATKTKYGIFELDGGANNTFPNKYTDNYFIGIDTEIFKSSNYLRMASGNFSYTAAKGSIAVEKYQFPQGNVTGATTFSILNSETIAATLTGNITVTLVVGDYKGQELKLILSQDATGSRTAIWPSIFKKAGGTLTLSTAANAVDMITMQWDGTYWREVSRALNLS